MSHINFSTKQAIIIFEQAEKNGYEPEWKHINYHLKKDDMYTNFHLNVELMYWGFKLIGVEGCFTNQDVEHLNEMYNNWLIEAENEENIYALSKYDEQGAILDTYEKYGW
jgi:hypothetical protein